MEDLFFRGRKYTSDVMINTVHQILDGSTSVSLAANKLDIDISTVRKWVHEYNLNGLDYFTERPRNNTYTKEFKQSVIDEYLEGTDSLLNLSLPNATEIGSSVFYNNIKDLSLAKSKKVGYAAFHSNNLVSVDLPETETIEELAFYGTEIETLVLSKIQTIEPNAFANNAIKELNVNALESFQNGVFKNNPIEKLYANSVRIVPLDTFINVGIRELSMESV